MFSHGKVNLVPDCKMLSAFIKPYFLYDKIIFQSVKKYIDERPFIAWIPVLKFHMILKHHNFKLNNLVLGYFIDQFFTLRTVFN